MEIELIVISIIFIWLKKDEIKVFDKKEKWKKIPDYPDYKISNYGKIYSKISEKELKPHLNSHGYYTAYFGSKRKQFFVHRLVFGTFTGEKIDPKKFVVDHIDRNKTNNFLGNLRKSTFSENSKNRDWNTSNYRKIDQYTRDDEFIKTWNNINEIIESEEFKGKSGSHIRNCYNGSKKTAYNYKWKLQLHDRKDDLSEFVPIRVFKKITFKEIIYENYRINKKGEIIDRVNVPLVPTKCGGYLTIRIIKEGEPKTYKIHRLVAMTFIENSNRLPIVNHKDENKHNNNAENLEWCDDKYNTTYSKGKKVNKLDIDTGEILETFDSLKDAVKSVGRDHISRIRASCNDPWKQSYNHKWSFVNEKDKKEIKNDFLDKFVEIDPDKFTFYGKSLFLTYQEDLEKEKLKDFFLEILPNNRKLFHIVKNEISEYTHVLIKFHKKTREKKD